MIKWPPCVQCGHCCTLRVCEYGGEWDDEKKQCRFLTEERLCSRHEEIKKLPVIGSIPMFGCGCSEPKPNPLGRR